MNKSNSLFVDVLKISVAIFLAGLFLTACFSEAERASNEGIRKSQEGRFTARPLRSSTGQ